MPDLTDPHTPILIKVDGTITELQPEGKTFGLKEMQNAVGGMIEIYPMPKHKSRDIKRIMVMNENGRIHGLPKNVIASAAFGPTGHIVGDVLICPSRLVK
jgi:hypothetical protein